MITIESSRTRWAEVVGDNIQSYYRLSDPRIGRENRKLKGFAGTVIELEDFDPEAFDAEKLLEQQSRLDRRDLTVDAILDHVSTDHWRTSLSDSSFTP